ncbi:DUF86 domain-containing protein [Halalkalibacterium halodurans]|uniref:BH3430 protein n=1 Tax=Halalkalibacterium halodurans (strain ATCC BAA-125 / DSM 18197 / FERM 7344 / JCM 9153 / C-125) TaxID=272558 RepID=Q9K7D4_HALH5|nr:DUF86 domain-containing protein [Halalkalibacterium halodurans]MDY7223960.1 DUF86 domain-containing protein [Halalkalibacterium halodurans]MDY7243181.1 DUF86 domain-containing protein [Halalkalibacterium halodurans]MED4080120.1 DUF86 domain-containing protein [Halalkalibacterium halodurans]MED4083343.1 DUF86 domain-containing protein [Halalkalibacterium halodurans]MED4105085.1 DUF86 domain-containing protein [Halalkalibacterium halodurans]
MYFVDRKTIEETLRHMEKIVDHFCSQSEWTSETERLALERIAHLVIESVIDVGNSMIDGFIMRDPGSYEDIVDILIDENVVDEADGQSLKALIACRKLVVQAYTAIDHQQLKQTFDQHVEAVKRFPERVRTYLEKELGPVSAFLPETDRHA